MYLPWLLRPEVGSMVNIITGTNVNNLTYNHVIIDREDEAINAATLSRKRTFFLRVGMTAISATKL